MLGDVGSDEDRELVWTVLSDNMELVQINVSQDLKFILLKALALEFSLGGNKGCLRLGHFEWIF